MKNIDFLPEVYRERIALRHARVWWGIVVLIFGTAIGSTAGAQFLLERSVQREFDELESQYTAAQAQVARLGQLQTANRTAGHWAGLATYLEQPWPRSQLIAEVVRPLPKSIRLTELIVAEEEMARPTTQDDGQRRRSRAEAQPTTRLDPPLADLEELRRTNDYKRPVIELSGGTFDEASLHKYVAALGRSPLIAEARIKSFNSDTKQAIDQPTTFTVRLVFKPSHGQPELVPVTAGAASGGGQLAQGGAGS